MDVKSFPILHEMKIVHGILNANPFVETGLQIRSLLRSLLTSVLSFLENTLFRIYFSSFIPKVNYSENKFLNNQKNLEQEFLFGQKLVRTWC